MGNDGIVDVGDRDGDGTIDRVVQLSVGYNHACELIEDQTVRCWAATGAASWVTERWRTSGTTKLRPNTTRIKATERSPCGRTGR